VGSYVRIAHYLYYARATFHANICEPLDAGMVIQQLCRWKFSHNDTLQQTLFD